MRNQTLLFSDLFLDFSTKRHDKQHSKTPKGDEEHQLTLAGLGKRSRTVAENITYSEVCFFGLEIRYLRHHHCYVLL